MNQIQNFQSHLQECNLSILPFNIHATQCVKDYEECKSATCSSNHFTIVWVTKQSGYNSANNKKLSATNDYLLFIKPGEFQNVKLNDAISGYIISFTASFLDFEDIETESRYGMLYQIFAHTEAIADCSDVLEDMHYITQIMLKEFVKHNLYRTEVLRHYLKIFLIYLSRLFEQHVKMVKYDRNTEILRIFMELLEKNFRNQRMVADYASRLIVTPNYLNEVVKKTTGYSAGHHIRQRVVLEAKKQAAYSNTCMKSIAYNLGFFDMAHFSKFFKNATGMNFSDFKKGNSLIKAA